jgi:kinesin family member 6/9
MNNVTQEEVYERVVKNVTLKTLQGYNGTIMCYGQTGAGKTFSMTGATENYQQRGIIPRTIQHLFKEIQSRPDYQYTVRYSISFYSIFSCFFLG